MKSSFKNIVSASKEFERDIDWFFDYTQDFNERIKWDKQTSIIAYLDGYNKLEKGAKVYTKSSEGISMNTEYLTFEPPNEISVKMLNHSNIFKNFIGYWNYTPINNYVTKLKITYEFDLRFPYSLFKSLVIKKVKKNVKRKLLFLENHLDGFTPN